MSKSLNNYIGVTDSPSEIYGKTMSIPDSLMMKYYTLLTGLPKAELDDIARKMKDNSLHPKDAKKRLARILVRTFYNDKEAEKAENEFENIFKDKNWPTNPEEVFISADENVNHQLSVPKLLVVTGATTSTSEGFRLIKQGGVSISGNPVLDAIWKGDIPIEGLQLQVGKRKILSCKEKGEII